MNEKECHCTEFFQTSNGEWFIMYYEKGFWNSMKLEDYKNARV